MAIRGDDTHLLVAARGGDLWAFEEVIRRHRRAVYRVALRMLGNPADAEDAAQDVFLQAWRALPGYRGESSASTWLYRIVANRCLNVLRARREEEPLDEGQEALASGTAALAQGRLELEALKQAIRGLGPEQRAPLVLRELEGLSYEEIAAVLDLTLAAVKGRIHRARVELVAAMREWR
jgi:RNA polymerase sigma-70 factor (ECF subfamily)